MERFVNCTLLPSSERHMCINGHVAAMHRKEPGIVTETQDELLLARLRWKLKRARYSPPPSRAAGTAHAPSLSRRRDSSDRRVPPRPTTLGTLGTLFRSTAHRLSSPPQVQTHFVQR